MEMAGTGLIEWWDTEEAEGDGVQGGGEYAVDSQMEG